MSAISFSFRPDAIPAYAQAEFLTRFCQLVLDYQTLTEPQQEAPPAESLPTPDFAPVEGDESVPVAPKKERKNPWAGLTEEQKAERLAAMKRGRAAKAAERRLSEDSLAAPTVAAESTPPAAVIAEAAPAETPLEEMTLQPLRDMMRSLQGKPTGVKTTPKFPTKEAIIAEIRRLRSVPAPAEDAASETSSAKQRKNPWADLTPEQKAERIAKMKAAREAKKEANLAAQGSA